MKMLLGKQILLPGAGGGGVRDGMGENQEFGLGEWECRRPDWRNWILKGETNLTS